MRARDETSSGRTHRWNSEAAARRRQPDELTGIDVVGQQFCHVGADLRVLEHRDGVGVGGELRRVVVDVLHGDVDVGLAVAPSSVHRPHREPVLVLLLSVQGLRRLQLPCR
ncbi:hypothetical protein EYF80_000285 [Liparis tanakae]|uniref:Uncharacterized protein n=1 Tax=Liparis tanakae TaxID=230148 RepID=A0A4Z2JK97_9TELE|nr:hypothetical protein EYF80_000285 [Liparis tanakae]